LGQRGMAMTAEGKNRILIFSPRRTALMSASSKPPRRGAGDLGCHRFLAPHAPWSALNNSALRVAVPSEGGMRDFDPAKCVPDFLHAVL
jgi:hypothetical protein